MKFIEWSARFEGPCLTMHEANSIEEAFRLAFPHAGEDDQQEMEEEVIDGIRSLRYGDDSLVGWNTEEEKAQTIEFLFEHNWAAYMDEDEKKEAAADSEFGFYFPLPEEVKVAFAARLKKAGF